MQNLDQALLKIFSAAHSSDTDSCVNTNPDRAEMKSGSRKTTQPPQAGSPAGERPRLGIFRPALEVDTFYWPKVCKELNRRVQSDIESIAGPVLSSLRLGRHVVLISGHQRGEGRTTAALCLAAALSRNNLRVVLVDADLERPQIAEKLGISAPGGWEDYPRDNSLLTEYLIESLADRFTILPSKLENCPEKWPTDLMFPMILETLRDHFDVVLIDAMPLVEHGLAESMLSDCGAFIDMAILLDTMAAESHRGIAWATGKLLAAGIEPLGVIRNAVVSASAA
jgi:Mrp family chromosome partitioning ATPase